MCAGAVAAQLEHGVPVLLAGGVLDECTPAALAEYWRAVQR